MELTTDKLEAKFQKAEADIDYISRKLESEFTTNSMDKKKVKENPAQILQKLSEIKKQYAAIVEEADAIRQAQQEAMEFFRGELTAMCEKLMALQAQVQPDQTLGAEGAGGDAQPGTSSQVASNSSIPEVTTTSKPQASNSSENEVSSSLGETPPSPFGKRKNCSEMIEVDNQEFESVSSLVRGRVKLSEVNQTYRILWHHFKEEGNTAPLTSSEMFKMGLRVTGQTGEAKLKVLRALKLLEISKKGDVKLL